LPADCSTPSVLGSARFELGEGARWFDGRLLWVDLLQGTLWEHVDGQDRVVLRCSVPLGAVAPLAGQPDIWLAACGDGFAMLRPTGMEWIDRPEQGSGGATRMNDACCDPAGRFLGGSMAYDNSPGAGSLYRLNHDGNVEKLVDGLTITNGPAFSPDGTTMYVADSARGRIYAYPYDIVNGSLDASTIFAEIRPDLGSPDGMTVDANGCLWSAIWGAGAIRRYLPDGRLDAVLPLPATQPTSCAFGGPTLSTLFITTAAFGIRGGTTEGAVLKSDTRARGVATASARMDW
jgi:sugar lactone lactonase YvrE